MAESDGADAPFGCDACLIQRLLGLCVRMFGRNRDGGGCRLVVYDDGGFFRQWTDGGDWHGRASCVGGFHDGFRSFGNIGRVAYAACVAAASSVSRRSDYQINPMDAVAVDGRDVEFIWYRPWNGSDGACVGLWRRSAHRGGFADARQAFIELDGPDRAWTFGDWTVRYGVVSGVVSIKM